MSPLRDPIAERIEVIIRGEMYRDGRRYGVPSLAEKIRKEMQRRGVAPVLRPPR